jgi:hypothetical protein
MEFGEGISREFREKARTIENRVCYSEFRSSIFNDSNFHLHGAYIRPHGYKPPFSVMQLPNSRITED